MANNPFTYFVNIKSANAEIERITTESAALAENYKAVCEQFDAGKAALLAKEAEIAELKTKLEAKADADAAAFAAEVEKVASLKAQEIVAAAGSPPLKTEAAKSNTTVVTRAEFDSMNNAQRTAFFRSGGRVS